MRKTRGARKACYETQYLEKDIEAMPTAYVSYLDKDNNKEAVPICNIPELHGSTEFVAGQVYDTFWAPPAVKNGPPITLPDFKKTIVGPIKRHPAQSSNTCGAGFYPSIILQTAGNCIPVYP